MTSVELDNLVRIGMLKREPATATEFQGLIRSGELRLADAEKASLSLESRFDLAYNAAHALRLYGAWAIAPTTGTWSFKCCPIPLACRPRLGGYWRRAMRRGIGRNTKASWRSRKDLSPT